MTKARKWWQCCKRVINAPTMHYDAAIAYSQCIPTFYVVEKINADKKIGWVNCIFHLRGKEKEWQQKYYQALDDIVLVSDASLRHFMDVYPEFSSKMTLMPDLISERTIENLSHEIKNPFSDNCDVRILTVARLDAKDKGYDIALEACRTLVSRGLKFKWYAIGKGGYRSAIESYLQKYNLEDTFVLLGTTPNPYPYMLNCSLYVQTSRHEGFGLSIAEARVLNRPVVTTEFDSVYNQMVPDKNGLVVPIDATAVADAVQRLLNDRVLYDSIVEYQRVEKKGNAEEISKFYKIIGVS